MSPNCGFINTPNLNYCLSSSKTQVRQFKKDVSNSATHDSIMNANIRLNLLICDTLLSKNLKLTILASNASSSSTKVFKCPHTKNDSILTHNGSKI
ncbi:hypothetical protein H5410_003356 [Solanum commersonii]|uniref:Uncharacterized protein n=1 Tax=Solanum commersonii TaxID=4109 RepID=A0A9J6B5E9_SOLCO|nr:hypothetical protein H5410_003356 [Solanum commersonii]